MGYQPPLWSAALSCCNAIFNITNASPLTLGRAFEAINFFFSREFEIYLSTMSTSQASPRPRRQRVKTNSSLSGMMLDENSKSERARSDSFSSYSDQEREELQEMTRKLRQAKRKLLLKHVEQPSSSVDKFREIILGLSVDAMEDDEGFSITNSFRGHSNSLRSITSSLRSITSSEEGD